MKPILLKLSVFAVVVSFMQSCATYHSGNLSDSASLSSANFSYVQQNISGTASATYLFGVIGGFPNKTLVHEAKLIMLEQHPLKDNQALANVSVNFRRTYVVAILSIECTVTADIVEFK